MNNRSMEEEVRVILKDATTNPAQSERNLVEIARDAVEPYGGFDIELPVRDKLRDDDLFD